MPEFNIEVLQRLDTMNDSMTSLNLRMTELEGKLKGNNELLKKEIQAYATKDVCALHREKFGERLSHVESICSILEKENETSSNRVTAWLPDMVKIILVIGSVIGAKAIGLL